jgi:hypothetical protein
MEERSERWEVVERWRKILQKVPNKVLGQAR